MITATIDLTDLKPKEQWKCVTTAILNLKSETMVRFILPLRVQRRTRQVVSSLPNARTFTHDGYLYVIQLPMENQEQRLLEKFSTSEGYAILDMESKFNTYDARCEFQGVIQEVDICIMNGQYDTVVRRKSKVDAMIERYDNPFLYVFHNDKFSMIDLKVGQQEYDSEYYEYDLNGV